jgi:hypothetical protein
VLAEAATRGGCLTEEQLEALHAQRLRSLSDTLAGPHLSDQQRTNIIHEVMAWLRAEPEPEPAIAVTDVEVTP